MKFILLFIFAVAVCTADEDEQAIAREIYDKVCDKAIAGIIDINDLDEVKYGKDKTHRYFMFPDDNGDLHEVDSLEPIEEDLTRSPLESINNYFLYTRDNPIEEQFLIFEDESSVSNSDFDASKETVFFVHGWKGNGHEKQWKKLIEVLLEDKDVNVIQVDWSLGSKRNYVTAMNMVPRVGRDLSKFIGWLTFLGLSLEKIHLIGFSLGGHVVGNAGRNIDDEKIQRITALDPAGPLWYGNQYRLVASDARYVEVIHTSLAGHADTCGHADFYPNAGLFMPGTSGCGKSHSRAIEYMTSTVKYNHLLANKCESVMDALFDNCDGVPLYPMGNSDVNKFRIGIFRVNTRPHYPF